jgi:hypothetical protein
MRALTVSMGFSGNSGASLMVSSRECVDRVYGSPCEEKFGCIVEGQIASVCPMADAGPLRAE